MTRRGSGQGVAEALAVVFAAFALTSTSLSAAGDPLYSQRLRMPADLDDFGYAESVTADPHTGEVFVCDPHRSRIAIFDADGIFRYQILGGRRFTAPRDVAVDPEGFLLVLANHEGVETLVELDFDGAFRRTVPLVGLPEEASPPTVVSVALSPTGDRIYALDAANTRLWIAGRDGAVTGSVGLAETDERGRPLERMLGRVDVSGDAVLVVVSFEPDILLLDLDGELRSRVGLRGTRACTLGSPNAAALSADGRLVVVDHQRMTLMLWDPAENRCLGEHYGFGTAPGYFYYPRDLALGPEGRLYVAQGFEGRVQVYQGLAPVASAGAHVRPKEAASPIP